MRTARPDSDYEQWVPFSYAEPQAEILPDEYEPCWVYDDEPGNAYGVALGEWTGYFWQINDEYPLYGVTHWHPIDRPDPPA